MHSQMKSILLRENEMFIARVFFKFQIDYNKKSSFKTPRRTNFGSWELEDKTKN